MEDLITKLPSWVMILPSIFTALILIATVVVRFTDSPKDDEVVSKVKKVLLGILAYFPTIGLNPNTKRMKEALAALSTKEKDAESSDSPS